MSLEDIIQEEMKRNGCRREDVYITINGEEYRATQKEKLLIALNEAIKNNNLEIVTNVYNTRN